MRVSELSCRLWVFPFAHEALARAGVGGGRIKNLGNNTDFVAKCPTGARFILRHDRGRLEGNAIFSRVISKHMSCHLAKFCDLMIGGKYGPTIG